MVVVTVVYGPGCVVCFRFVLLFLSACYCIFITINYYNHLPGNNHINTYACIGTQCLLHV